MGIAIQKISIAKNSFQKEKHRQVTFGRVLRDYYERLRNSDTSTQEYIARSLTALHYVLNKPELIDPQLLNFKPLNEICVSILFLALE